MNIDSLTAQEKRLILNYRACSADMKICAMEFIKTLARRGTGTKTSK